MQATVDWTHGGAPIFFPAPRRRAMMRIQLPDPGMLPLADVEQQQLDRRSARFFTATGGPFIPVPGLMELREVRLPGLLMEKEIERTIWVDGRPEQAHTLVTDCVFVLRGIDGVPMLGRSRWSNDGVWQKDLDVMVIGEWDETVSPVPNPAEAPSMETVHRPVLTAGDISEGGEISMRPGKKGT